MARLRIEILHMCCKIFHSTVKIVPDETYEPCKTGFNVNHVICALHEKPHEERQLVAAFFCTCHTFVGAHNQNTEASGRNKTLQVTQRCSSCEILLVQV